jgi:3-deoxy-manno-octulosonate cytidylyltransferase (CMP-KDO synthetase)
MKRQNEFLIIIPVRLNSTRLPKKALIKIKGKILIQHVIDIAKKTTAKKVIVATDSLEIKKKISNLGVEVLITSKKHNSGTTRIIEAVKKLNLGNEQMILNLQGDEPGINPKMIDDFVSKIQKTDKNKVYTICKNFKNFEEFSNHNNVKVIKNNKNYALYFSRQLIPFFRNSSEESIYNINKVSFKHIGIYLYSVKLLKKIDMMNKSKLEKFESLEQLKWLDNNIPIICHKTNYKTSPGIDTEDDLRYYF